MTETATSMRAEAMAAGGHSPGVALRSLIIGLTAFLTGVG